MSGNQSAPRDMKIIQYMKHVVFWIQMYEYTIVLFSYALVQAGYNMSVARNN